MQKLLFLEPIFQERIWGGERLKTVYNYEIPNKHTGECWAISAHKNGDCIIKNGVFKGKNLSEVYQNHRELFNNIESPVFPLLTKILDANNDLSVQVHPDDEYALRNVGELGKTECWYVLASDEDATMVYGHNAKTEEELVNLIQNNEWEKLLRKINIYPGDFYYVPAGTIHAICKGTLVLETQQSSDTTYRVYDYDRVSQDGKKRPLHIKQALEVTRVPHKDYQNKIKVNRVNDSTITTFVEVQYFSVEKWDIKDTYEREIDNFFLVSVINGEGKFNNESIKKGDHFIVTSINDKIICRGNLELIVSYITK